MKIRDLPSPPPPMTHDEAIEILREILPRLSASRSHDTAGILDVNMNIRWLETVTVLLMDIYDITEMGYRP